MYLRVLRFVRMIANITTQLEERIMAMKDFIVIEKSRLDVVHALAKNEGLILDAAYGHGQDRLEIRFRKMGPKGNHEPKWTQEQRENFNLMFGQQD